MTCLVSWITLTSILPEHGSNYPTFYPLSFADLETVQLMDGLSSDDDVEHYKQVNGNHAGQSPTFTAEEGVEAIGFGFFQIRLYIICGLFTVCTCSANKAN